MKIKQTFLAASLVASGLCCGHSALAQDSTILPCAQFQDRADRIACLEDALEAVVAAQTNTETANTQLPVSSPQTTPELATSPAKTNEQAAAPTNEAPSLIERIRNFGQKNETNISTDAEGQDQLHDSIAALEKRKGLWLVTLTSGQVWQQLVPRNLNLREGDTITIDQSGFGNGYQLSASRLNGFIRVERVK